MAARPGGHGRAGWHRPAVAILFVATCWLPAFPSPRWSLNMFFKGQAPLLQSPRDWHPGPHLPGRRDGSWLSRTRVADRPCLRHCACCLRPVNFGHRCREVWWLDVRKLLFAHVCEAPAAGSFMSSLHCTGKQRAQGMPQFLPGQWSLMQITGT